MGHAGLHQEGVRYVRGGHPDGHGIMIFHPNSRTSSLRQGREECDELGGRGSPSLRTDDSHLRVIIDDSHLSVGGRDGEMIKTVIERPGGA